MPVFYVYLHCCLCIAETDNCFLWVGYHVLSIQSDLCNTWLLTHDSAPLRLEWPDYTKLHLMQLWVAVIMEWISWTTGHSYLPHRQVVCRGTPPCQQHGRWTWSIWDAPRYTCQSKGWSAGCSCPCNEKSLRMCFLWNDAHLFCQT